MGRQSQVLAPGRGITRYQIALLLALAGIALLYTAVKFQSQAYWTSTPLEHRDGAKYSRLWIDGADQVVGSRVEGSRITIEKWSGPSWKAEVNAADWSISPDLK